MHEHREGQTKGFSQRYDLKMLVYYERHNTPRSPSDERKTPSTGRASENLNWWSHSIRGGGICGKILRAEPHHGCPGQARA
jgi:hypothetical protein